MFTQAIRPFEGVTTTVNSKNMVEKSPAKWSRPICALLQYGRINELEDDINHWLEDTTKHICSLSDVTPCNVHDFTSDTPIAYVQYNCTIVYQTRTEQPS